MIAYVKLKNDIFGVIGRSFWGIYTNAEHLREQMLHGNWLNEIACDIISIFCIFS